MYISGYSYWMVESNSVFFSKNLSIIALRYAKKATSSAFVALRQDGTVHTWGLPFKGGDNSSVQDNYVLRNDCVYG